MPMSIVVVGSINADLRVRVGRHPKPGETLPGVGGGVSPGGKGANQAVAAALLGGQVRMIGAVGDDAHAVEALSILKSAGVDLSGVDLVPGPTGLALVVVADSGENSIIVVPGANGTVDARAAQRHSKAIADAGVVVVQGEIPAEGIEAAARLAKGRLVVNLAPVVPIDPATLRRADPLVVNEHEGALTLEGLGRSAEGLDEESVVNALLQCGVPSVVMTLGPRGALVADGSTVEQVLSPRVDAVDSTGAGDAFVGALVGGLAQGDSLLEAARFAARVGAFACLSEGAQASYPSSGDTLPATGA